MSRDALQSLENGLSQNALQSLEHDQSLDHGLSQNAPADGRGSLCGGCKLSVESDTGGIVVAFGQALWHVDCFKCAKCGNRVNADTNLLLLSDGSPVCGSCSYNCSVCKHPILDEAIMTGDESYHAACFICRSCSRKIEELVFAKTSQGIYCMACHNERVARSRRHAEAKKKKQAKQKREEEQKKEVSMVDSVQTPSRSVAEPQTSPPPSAASPSFDPSIGTPRIQNANSVQQHPAKRISTTEIHHNGPLSSSSTLPPDQSFSSFLPAILEPAEPPSQPAPAAPLTEAAPAVQQTTRERDDTLRLPNGNGEVERRRSFDDRPTSQYTKTLNPESNLGVPATKVERRRSMQPALQKDAPLSKERRQNSGPPAPQGFSSASQHDTHGLLLDPLRTKGAENSGQQLSPTGDRRAVRLRANSMSPGQSPQTSRSTTPVPSGVHTSERANEEDTSGHALPLPLKERYDSVSPHRGVGTPQTPVPPALPPISFTGSNSFSDLISSVTDSKSGKKLRKEVPPIAVPSEESSAVSPISVESAISTTKFGSAPSSQNGHASSFFDPHGSPVPVLNDPHSGKMRERVDSSASVSSGNSRPVLIRSDTPEAISRKLRETLNEAKGRAAPTVELDRDFVETILTALQRGQARASELKTHVDHMKRASQRVYDGLAVAQDEYDQELAYRRDAEAEVGRLRLKVSAQRATIDAMVADHQKQENLAKMEKDMLENLQTLSRELSKLRAEREMTLAEVEELNATRKAAASPEAPLLSRSLTNRFDNIRTKYRSEIEPLSEQREVLLRELNELKTAKEKSLEEATRLTAQNESLQELNVKMRHQHDTLQSMMKPRPPEKKLKGSGASGLSNPPSTSTLHSVASSGISGTLLEAQEENRYGKGTRSDTELNPAAALRKFGWFKSGGGKDASSKDATLKELPAPPMPRLLSRAASPPVIVERPRAPVHNFQQQGILRAARCDHCTDKMWGSQLRCTICGVAVHTRCLNLTQLLCRESTNRDEKETVVDINQPLPLSMFGRDLIEQVRLDAKGGKRLIPIIVEKCISAVEALAMDYEGIYRKTGGASQSKMITQLFERGAYDSFDLHDTDQFPDICSVTSVLKTYFRTLPNPLLTYDLHDQLVMAAGYRDPVAKGRALANLVNELPPEHFETLRHLMLHLHGVMLQSDVNLMTARNLGVVFGPTLMRSVDSAKEFADMAGKSLAIEWLIENATTVLGDTRAA